MKIKRILTVMSSILLVISLSCSIFAYSQVSYGSRGDDVKTMQTMLNKVINAGLAVDGIFGGKSQSAVRSYQSSKGLDADGICGPKTWAALSADYSQTPASTSTSTTNTVIEKITISHSQLSSGSRGEEVKTLQRYLNQLIGAGLDVDGIFGNKTADAVKSYQSSRGLTADGICGQMTWAKLDDELGNNVIKKTKTVPVESTLQIASGKYNPGTLSVGQTYSINGLITSNYTITSVTVAIYDSNGNTTASVKTVNPNSTQYNIYGTDSSIRFGTLSAGSYTFKVVAQDASGKSKTLVNNTFTVKDRPTVILSSSKYEEMAKATHENQSSKMCVLTAFALLLKSKLYSENKNYSDVTQYTIKEYNDNELNCNWSKVCNKISARSDAPGNLKIVERSSYSANDNINYVINLLKSRPEGLVAYFYYSGSQQHAVRICNYDSSSGVFYVSDPGKYYIPYTRLEDSLIGNGYYSSLRGDYQTIFGYLNTVVFFN